MEQNKIQIECTTSEAQLCEIIKTNNPEDVAKSFRDYITRQTNSWWTERDRADKAEKQLREIEHELAKVYIVKLKSENQ